MVNICDQPADTNTPSPQTKAAEDILVSFLSEEYSEPSCKLQMYINEILFEYSI